MLHNRSNFDKVAVWLFFISIWKQLAERSFPWVSVAECVEWLRIIAVKWTECQVERSTKTARVPSPWKRPLPLSVHQEIRQASDNGAWMSNKCRGASDIYSISSHYRNWVFPHVSCCAYWVLDTGGGGSLNMAAASDMLEKARWTTLFAPPMGRTDIMKPSAVSVWHQLMILMPERRTRC